jgi:ribonuclease E
VYEPELTRAVPDLDFAPQPSFEPPPDSEVQVRAREAQTPTQEQPTPTSAEPVIDTAEAEPLRRRSTVREPAPMRSSGEEHVHDAAPSPSAQPVVSLPAESATEDQPRRSGWWSRRVLGRH